MAHQIQKLLRTTPNVIGRAFSSSYNNVSDMHKNSLHLAVQREYPKAETLPLPQNVDPNETTRFSPLRTRDITASAITVHDIINEIDVTTEQRKEAPCDEKLIEDEHLRGYDRHSPINLSSSMQTLVPEPFSPPPNDLLYSSYLSFPGGGWGQQTKYLSHELNASHYTELRQEMRSDWSSYKGCINPSIMYYNRVFGSNLHLLNLNQNLTNIPKRFISIGTVQFCSNQNESKDVKPEQKGKETGRSKLKKAVKEYGSTVVVFHVGISLISLGICYTLVSSGLDVCLLLEKMNLADKLPKIAENASTFIIAYAVHKVFAPVRISITLFSTPFIVKYLRKRNFLK